MLRVGSWLYGKKPGNASHDSADEEKDCATFILNDDVESAENELAKGNSTFHNVGVTFPGGRDDLGKGVVAFVRATLGFEQDIMRQASERLNEAETTAASEQHRAQNNSNAPHVYRSDIYAPGTEYLLCQAIAQLMSAVVGVLNESLTESIKAFYRLRKAYITLDGIAKMEEKFMEAQAAKGIVPRSSDLSRSSAHSEAKSAAASSVSNKTPEAAASEISRSSTPGSNINHDPDSDIFKNEIDVFVHSGTNFCFGILLILISMVPPAFSKLLSIIGFRGDKARGIQMLWQASKFHNLIGGLAALALLGYYNGFVRYCDIMPDAAPGEDESYPQERLEALLTEMRARFPVSMLWILEDSRMRGANKDLEGALELLSSSKDSQLKQVKALCVFEKSLNALFLHRYETCAEAFIECVDLNSWSRSLYYYIAGSCHAMLYRQNLDDPEKAKVHAEKATEFIRKAPQFAGKKRFMARQLPFDVFVTRKIAKWEARAKEWGVELVDAIGVDPIEEMIFFWNGHSRMTDSQLEDSLQRLAWCESDANKTWSREGPEEKAILDLLRAAVHRSLRNHEQAKMILSTRVLIHDKPVFKGHLKDDWVLPAAHFEFAANSWMERPTYQVHHGLSTEPVQPGSEAEMLLVKDCKEHLDRAARWESYELDARIGLKVTAAQEAVRKWETMHSTTL
ncbi:hypothetical protein N7468_001879 [Penicillium chermesinum]|uniref:Inclusion body clearance protein IML2 n=1 Tax=Penicillium chermesinum TaxID=63820 RepID=A0A9W9PJ58_9EURO|nr:uncharacterized protein N7468_001879 [Penicillium chermesinum]KAJ5246896.1 hypothetical protein N7468_001879 [Penicillium chermesinum]KAJ6145152.1 hypothetical protein N7470_009047 [Penicillium chermesinum]